ncbi:MAG: hypothetical protein GY884_08560 [Proteobacteria bacterium]|nr:hypothetical protein [Pseudomonadota bacterium]
MTCYPHAAPALLGNVVTDNTSESDDPTESAGGVGAAYLRATTDNVLRGNTRDGEPSDFGWFHRVDAGCPEWVSSPSLAENYWGTTDAESIELAVFDGTDDDDFGLVGLEPVLSEAPTALAPRVVITTKKLRLDQPDEEIEVFLSVYNPGQAATLTLELTHERDGQDAGVPSSLDFPDAVQVTDGVWELPMPADGVWFGELTSMSWDGGDTVDGRRASASGHLDVEPQVDALASRVPLGVVSQLHQHVQPPVDGLALLVLGQSVLRGDLALGPALGRARHEDQRRVSVPRRLEDIPDHRREDGPQRVRVVAVEQRLAVGVVVLGQERDAIMSACPSSSEPTPGPARLSTAKPRSAYGPPAVHRWKMPCPSSCVTTPALAASGTSRSPRSSSRMNALAPGAYAALSTGAKANPMSGIAGVTPKSIGNSGVMSTPASPSVSRASCR